MKKIYSPADIVKSGLCIGCGSCVANADLPEIKMTFNKHGNLVPDGNDDWLIDRNEKFSRLCPFSPMAFNEDQLAENLFPTLTHTDKYIGRYHQSYVGFVNEPDYRRQGSSGGMVTWVAAELLRKGLIDGVVHVVASTSPQNEKRFFKYQISRTESAIRKGAKSRYYPIELSEVLKLIQQVPGRYAIIGIPCFIKAVQLLRHQNPIFNERIKFTLGLFCGHMKSARFVESFAWQMNVPVNEIKQIDYRRKNPDRPANIYTVEFILYDGRIVEKDWWWLVDGDWGAGFFMNAACNFCDDVVAETADISFGDAWLEPYTSDGKGTNVVIVRSSIIDEIIKDAIEQKRLVLETVDNKFVEETQAAGFRQRQEGLAYRLSWFRLGLQPVKRVKANSRHLKLKRKLIYRLRYFISVWSHHLYQLKNKNFYIFWARFIVSVYHGIVYYRGKTSEMIKRYRVLKN